MTPSDETPSAPSQPGPAAAPEPSSSRRTLIFANDKSSGKTTTANAVLVGLLERFPHKMRGVDVWEYDRQPRLSKIFRKEDGLRSMEHHDARNAAAFDEQRQLAADPNATVWDDLLYRIGTGGLVVDLGANIFADICRILDDEPRPVFPDGGENVGVVVPVTTAFDSIESAIAASQEVLGWGKRVQLFLVEQEYLGRLGDATPDWVEFRDRVLVQESPRVQMIRIQRRQVADIGRVVFHRIDRTVEDAQKRLEASGLSGAEYIRAVRAARTEVAWGADTLEAVRPIVDWFGR